MTNQRERKPVVAGRDLVVKHVCRPIVGGDDGIDAAIVVQVAYRETAAHPCLLKDSTRFRRDIHEALAGVARQQHRLLIAKLRKVELDGVEVVALSDEQVLPSVVVVVEKANTPAGVEQSHPTDAAHVSVVGK